ncbi:MAG: aminotransferase class V-fold PLP-dependent enzyme [Peptococcaceae bacterium]|nr:aminotransferase class V-fold PLP-dependent enzyme [Peptococcaceae bacterium]
MIYLDNAATSFPKPESVCLAVDKAMREACGNPGRSGHRLSLAAGRLVEEARLLCANLFHARSANEIIFTHNATAALNLGVKGAVGPGDHIITSTLEHNSVARPLYYLEQAGAEVTKIPTDIHNGLDPDDVKRALRPNTKLVVCAHISNVTGTVSDIAAIGSFCRQNGLLFMADAAQSAGAAPIDVQSMNIDLLAFPGHKGLLGPQGTGGLYIREGVRLNPLIQGGTGSRSESLLQPEDPPEKFESGTLNTPGLAGLAAGIRFLLEQGINEIQRKENTLTKRLIEGIRDIRGIHIIGPGPDRRRGSVVSIRLDAASPGEAALMLDAAFGIAVRSGLHCASDAHRAAGTLESGGTVRISPGCMNTLEDIEACLAALRICALA